MVRNGLLSWTATAVHTVLDGPVQSTKKRKFARKKTRIDKQKQMIKKTSKPNGSKYIERIRKQWKCFLLSKFDSYAYVKTTVRMQSRQFHSQSLTCQWPILHFVRELRKRSQNLKTFAGHWDSSFGKFRNFSILATKKATTFCTKWICLSLNIYLAISWTYGKATFRDIYWAEFKSTEIFALRQLKTFQPNMR